MNEIYKKRLALFPDSTRLESKNNHTRLTISGQDLFELAQEFGTPLYVYDRATLDSSVDGYKEALSNHYSAPSGITYAGKAFLCLAIAQWTQEHGLTLDCTGAGEIAIAEAAGTPRSNTLVHGVNKSQIDLEAAIHKAGIIVVDNLDELQRLVLLSNQFEGSFPDLWLRFRPGLAVDTHTFRQTGQDDSKFGMGPSEIEQAVQQCDTHHLPLKGLHFHQGSHFHDPAPLRPAIQAALNLLASIKEKTGWYPETVCTGGGWGIPYHEDELSHPSVESYLSVIGESLTAGCIEHHLPLPRLQVEPGRSLVARAGVAIYEVGAIKHTTSRRWIVLDGGLADNPRPALYGARYSALPVLDPQRPSSGAAWLGGPFCESGDILIENLPMPDLSVGELVAIPASGAYQLSMGSNYNGARKPAVVWLDQDRAHLIQRRETLEDLYRRDIPLPLQQGAKI